MLNLTFKSVSLWFSCKRLTKAISLLIRTDDALSFVPFTNIGMKTFNKTESNGLEGLVTKYETN